MFQVKPVLFPVPNDQVIGSSDSVDSEPQVVTPVESPVSEAPVAETSNPSWESILGVIPDNLQHLVKPELEKWDRSVQGEFEKRAEELKKYEPYKEVVGRYQPERVQAALRVADLIDEDPANFLREMSKALGLGEEDDEPEQLELGIEGLENTPQFQELKKNQDALAAHIQAQVEREQQVKWDSLIESTIKPIEEKYGPNGAEYVLLKWQAGVEPADALKSYEALVNSIRSVPTASSNAPVVVAPGGGVPSTQVDPASLDKTNRKALVAQLLAEAAKTT